MSTKTTYKRIALVAVAALGFGLLSVAPSNATAQSDTLAISATGNATSISYGSAASTTLTQTFLAQNSETMTVTVSLVSGPVGNTVVPTLTADLTNGSNGTPSASGLVGTMIDTITATGGVYGLASGKWTLAIAPGATATAAGVYVIKVTPAYSGRTDATVAAAVTWTVTVGAQATAAPADSTSTSIISPYTLVASGSTADQAVSVAATGSAIALIKVSPLVAGSAATGSTVISVTITGPGTLSLPVGVVGLAASSGLKSVSTGSAAGPFYIYVYGDGTTGNSTVTSTMGSIVLTETINTYGAAASAVATVVKPVIAVGSTASVGAVTVVVKDANGNTVPNATVYAQSGTTTVFASSSVATGSTGIASFDLTALVAGTSSFVFSNVAAGSTAVYTSAAVSVRAGSATPGSVVMSLDKATYSQGEAATLTIMVKDAADNTIADNTAATVFTSTGVTSSRALSAGTSLLPAGATVATGSSTGTLTYAINVPTTSGAFTISASAGSGLTGTFSVTATVSQSAAEIANADAIAAAADAAAEATDAANAATDAANAAAEAADAATAAAQDAVDAVATLGTQVAELVAGLKAQIAAQKAAITALTNLVIKIQKKLKA